MSPQEEAERIIKSQWKRCAEHCGRNDELIQAFNSACGTNLLGRRVESEWEAFYDLVVMIFPTWIKLMESNVNR